MSTDNLTSKDTINVIDEFDYSTQNTVYSESFRAWRQRRGNKYAFSFEKNERETVYVDSRGFVSKSPVTAEKKSLTAIFFTIGIATLMWIVLDTVFSKLFILILNVCGVNINTEFSSSIIYGGSAEVAMVLIIISTIKLLVPLIYLHIKLKIPLEAEFLSDMNNPLALLGAISITFIVCVAASIPSAYSSESKEVYEFFASSGADLRVWNQSEFLIYSIFDVLVMPLATQLLFCGSMFTVLRQFGDPFAIVMTSLTAALLTQDFRTMPAIFLVTMVGAYGMLTSGTIFTAIVVNILYKMYNFTVTIIENNATEYMMAYRMIFMCSVLIVGALGLVIYRNIAKKQGIHLAHYTSELTFVNRVIHASKTFPFSAVSILCVIYAFMKVVL